MIEADLMLTGADGFTRPTARALATSGQLKVSKNVLIFGNRGPQDQVKLVCEPK